MADINRTYDYSAMSNDELFKLYAKDRANLRLRNAIVEKNLPLVWLAVNAVSCGRWEREEYESIASLYLIRAVERYDIELGYTFAAYASSCINGAIKMATSAMIGNGSRRAGDQLKKIGWAQQNQYKRTGTMPSKEEITAVARTKPSVIDGYYRAASVVPLERVDENGRNYEIVGHTPPDPADRLGAAEMVALGLRTVHPMYREALRDYYLCGLTLAEVGRTRGISRERARQMIEQGLFRIRRNFERRGITFDG